MKLIIDIPEYLYEQVLDLHNESILGLAGDFTKDLIKGVAYGTPLPKGHGRLIDADKIMRVDHIVLESTIDDAPTIIEADKE